MNDSYEFEGVVEEVLEPFTSPKFNKREVVVTDGPEVETNYPRHLIFTFKKANAVKLDSVRKGDRVKIKFVLDGRKWEGPKGVRYFVELTGFDIRNYRDSQVTPPATAQAPEEVVDSSDVPF